jgi:MFS family permease
MARHSGRAESAGWLRTIKQGEAFRALRNRNYRLLWIGQLGHSAALWVETIARSWLIWELTGSATLLATVNLLRAIPMLILGLLAGVAADRFDKRKLLIITKSVTLVNYLVMATLITTGAVQVWHVLVSAFVMGSSMAFEQPTRTSLVPSLVGKEELTNAVALNSAAMNITRVAGPAAAGLLIAPLGVGGVYYISAGVYIGTLIATIMMRVPPMKAREVGTSAWVDLAEGFRYVYREKTILVLMILALIPMVFGMPYMTLMPIFADKILNIGASGLGWLHSASGVGALLAVFTIATLGRVNHKGFLAVIGIFAFGAFLMVFAQSTWVPLSILMMVLIGYASTAFRVLINTSLLETSPPELHGRVMAFYTLDRGLVPLGTMTVGPLADVIGAPLAELIMGGICALLAVSVGIGVRTIRRI